MDKDSSHYLLHTSPEKPQSNQRTNFNGRLPEIRTKDLQIGSKRGVPTENVALTEKTVLSSKSSIAQLCPILDDNGILRASGQLSKADFDFDTEHLILQPSKHPKMQLMILNCRLDEYYQGVGNMRHELQQTFWILGFRNTLRGIKSCCVHARNTVRMSRLQLSPIYLATEWKR